MQATRHRFRLIYCSKFIFIGAFFVFMVGSLICGAAQSSIMFILGRAVAGCGGAGILNGAFVIIAAAAPMGARPSKLLSPIASTAILITFGICCRTHWYYSRSSIYRSCYRPTHWGSFDAACELEMVYAFQSAFLVSYILITTRFLYKRPDRCNHRNQPRNHPHPQRKIRNKSQGILKGATEQA